MKGLLSKACALSLCFVYSFAEASITDDVSVFYDMYLSAKESGDTSKAVEYATILLGSESPSLAPPEMISVAEELSEYFEEKFKFSEAVRWREYAMNLYESTKADPIEGARNEYRLAKLHYRTGEFHRAYEHVSRVVDILRELKDEESYLQCLNLLGALHYVCKDYEKSNYYFRNFAKGAESINDSTLQILALNNIAVYTNSISDSVKTRSLIMRCIELSKGLGDNSLLCKMYINISASYINAGNFEAAREHLAQAFPLLGDIEEFGQYYHYMGVLSYVEGREEQAVDYLCKAISYYEQGDFASREQFCLELLQDLYAREGRFEDAYDVLYRYYYISKNNSAPNALIELFRTRLELVEAKKQEETLSLEKKRTVTTIVGFSILVIVAVVVYLIFKKREYDIHRRESELATRKEMLEFKRTMQYKADKLVEETIKGLKKLIGETDNEHVKSELLRMCNDLKATKDQDEWNEIKEFVPQFNSEFYKKLIAAFPDLTINERRLCVLLNMNLTTKEISDITRQSTQSINTARARLRKKLGITGDDISIQEFLSKFL